MSGLADAVALNRDAEMTRAARALLRRPVLRARGTARDEAELVVLVRRHAPALREWFLRNTGWPLVVDAESVRLVKVVPDTTDGTHPARDPRTRLPFTRRRYVLTCLALAALERADAQVSLGRLAEQVVLGAADPALAAVEFTLQSREQRGDLVSVVRLLLDLGVLVRVAGDEESFLRVEGDVLYDVDRRVLGGLLATPRGPSTVGSPTLEGRLAALTEELPAATEELRNQAQRRRLTRLLLDSPVVYVADLDESERTYLTSQRHALTSRITELTGLVAEVRAEGVAMVDPFDELTDVRMPDTGTEGHVTLLLAEHLAGRTDPVAPAELHERVRRAAVEHRAYWRRDAAEAGAEVELVVHALGRLRALRLVDVDDSGVHARPALSRYAVAEVTVQRRTEAS